MPNWLDIVEGNATVLIKDGKIMEEKEDKKNNKKQCFLIKEPCHVSTYIMRYILI